MDAHEALKRHEEVTHGHGFDDPETASLAQRAALVVAVIAAFLAIATFMANETVKEVITGETKAADTSQKLEANDTKTTIADANATLLRVIGADSSAKATAVAKAEALDARITQELAPEDRALAREITADHAEVTSADHDHFIYELSEVALQIGIVLAGVSILARRQWLLSGGVAVAVAGVALLALAALT